MTSEAARLEVLLYAGWETELTMRQNYGIDAPGLVRGFLLAGVGLLTASAAVFAFGAHTWAVWVGSVLLLPALYALFMFALMLWGSLVGKVRDRERILNLISWSGNEHVLDVGCGRGLMLVASARRLTTGRAVGVDIWAAKDQFANDPQATLENARLEGVAERVTVETADMRDLPFPDHSFDVIVSSWVIHNLEEKAERARALKEITRVVRTGGAVLLTDIVHREEYEGALKDLGLEDVRIVVLSTRKDRLFRAVSFGSFQPATVVARMR